MRVPRCLVSSLLLLILTSYGAGEDSRNDISVRGAETPDGGESRNNEAAGEVGSAADIDGTGEGETRETVGDSDGAKNESGDSDGKSENLEDRDGERAGTDGCGTALNSGVSTLSVSANGNSRSYIRVIP